MTPEKVALKLATSEMIRGVGGVEAAAKHCRVGKSVLSDYQSRNNDDHFAAIDVVADLEPLACAREGWPHVTRLLAASMGFSLVRLPEVSTEPRDLLAFVGWLSRNGGTIAGTICEAIASGRQIDKATARALRRQVRESLEQGVALDATLAAIEEAA